VSAPVAADRVEGWRALQTALAAARRRLAAGGSVGLEPLERGLQAFSEAERRPPAGPEEEAALLALLDELEGLAIELAAERERLRGELDRLDRAERARRGYAALGAD